MGNFGITRVGCGNKESHSQLTPTLTPIGDPGRSNFLPGMGDLESFPAEQVFWVRPPAACNLDCNSKPEQQILALIS